MLLLEVENLTKHFGGLVAVNDLSFSLKKGEILSVIGPNGAGKTTVFNIITGIYPPSKGKVLYFEQPIHGLTPERICALGLARTFQTIRLFGHLTVEENVTVAQHTRTTAGVWDAILSTRLAREERALVHQRAQALLAEFTLDHLREHRANSLPYGDQRRLEIVRALATEPTILLLDEPAAGLNPQEASALMKLIEKVRERGVTVLLVEHHMRVVMGISDRVIVLDYGRKIAEGKPLEIQRNQEVIKAYLGTEVATSVATVGAAR
jgi:branched-chain amino acid transport system ATP-binding protein